LSGKRMEMMVRPKPLGKPKWKGKKEKKKKKKGAARQIRKEKKEKNPSFAAHAK